MAFASLTATAFEPLFTKQDALENLSAAACKNRDIARRVIAVLASKTPEEMLECVRNPEITAQMVAFAEEIKEYAAAEAEIAECVLARISWAHENTPTAQDALQ